jgi:hypothetical protein
VEATIDILNSRSERRRVWIDPWCSEHFLAPSQQLRIVIEDALEPTFEVEETVAETIVLLYRHSAAYIVDHGIRRPILDCWCQTPASPTGSAG